jgi:hypothetical protein
MIRVVDTQARTEQKCRRGDDIPVAIANVLCARAEHGPRPVIQEAT